jgi:hypothetical protein
VVAEAVHQNGVTLHTPNRMLDKDTDLTSGCIGSLVLLASLGRWILVTLARFLVRYCKLLPTVIRLHTQRASIDAHMQIGTPVPSGREFLLQPAGIMLMPAQGAPKKEDELIRQSHDGILQRLAFFLPL